MSGILRHEKKWEPSAWVDSPLAQFSGSASDPYHLLDSLALDGNPKPQARVELVPFVADPVNSWLVVGRGCQPRLRKRESGNRTSPKPHVGLFTGRKILEVFSQSRISGTC
jgi:hypothetical protein